MLLGLHIVRELQGVDVEIVHYAIYSMSATVGLIIMIAALFNIYSINFKKGEHWSQISRGIFKSFFFSYSLCTIYATTASGNISLNVWPQYIFMTATSSYLIVQGTQLQMTWG